MSYVVTSKVFNGFPKCLYITVNCLAVHGRHRVLVSSLAL
uniref:Uncharacterized protein n=1 Tax=Anguilla anguilla TaxID=7936 RepID=A0A0E9TNF5_ANGAN